MIFVDSSAIVAILFDELERREFLAAIEQADRAITSPIAVYEATMGLRRRHFCTVSEAEYEVLSFIEAANIEVVAITSAAARTAIEASSRFGKSVKRLHQLNMGDCFAYGVAKHLGARLLAKGLDLPGAEIG